MKNKYALLFVLCLLPFFSAAEQGKLEGLLDRILAFEYSTNPIDATANGIEGYANKLADLSPEALQKANQTYASFLQELDQIDLNQLSRSEQITWLMQRRNLQSYVDNYRFNTHFMPITSEYGFHEGIAQLPKRMTFRSVIDFNNYLSRLEQFPAYFEQRIMWMRKGMESGFVQPKVVLQGFELTVSSYFDKAVTDSPFYQPFKDLRSLELSDDERLALKTRAQHVIQEYVFSAYRSFHDFMVEEYIPGAKSDIAAHSWKHGKDYYQNQIEYYTTTSMTADEIHQLGLQEVARIRAEMQAVIDSLNFEGDINAFIQYLRTDPKFYAKSSKELLKHAAYFSKKMDAELPKLFYKLPRTPYGVQPVPANIAPKYTTGRYVRPQRDDQPGLYWVNTYALDKRPLYAIPALTLHEAVPGHHLQISLASEMGDLPHVRRYTYISAFGEGWGLYSEYLGKEVGIYEDPYNEFGRLSYEMWRACRLVVDTGMHTKGWSRQQALDYMLENTALSEHNVRTEIDRYISWPAQALSYKIGELEIKRLRKKAKKALGQKFDLRAFHDAVLAHGSVPLSVLDENISQFIQVHSSD